MEKRGFSYEEVKNVIRLNFLEGLVLYNIHKNGVRYYKFMGYSITGKRLLISSSRNYKKTFSAPPRSKRFLENILNKDPRVYDFNSSKSQSIVKHYYIKQITDNL